MGKSRTFKLSYRGTSVMVREGFDGRIELHIGEHRQEAESKTFEAATNEARKWLLDNAGDMIGTYDKLGYTGRVR